MLMVVFGAGASYDSAPSRHPLDARYRDMPNRPPLADQLFSDRTLFGDVMSKYPKCADITPRLRHLQNGVSIETVLQDIQSQSGDYPERVQQLASIRYYLQEILSTCVNNWLHECKYVLNHRTLIDDIKRWRKNDERVCFVTFNYDQLIDWSLGYCGFPMASLADYVAGKFMLVKLHGSVNWARVVDTPFESEVLREPGYIARSLIDRFGKVEISQRYVIANGLPPSAVTNAALFPALAIPVEAKLDFECPQDHIEALKACIPHVTKILVIGWRATEKPFLKLLKDGLKSSAQHIMVVNGATDNSQSAANNIQQAGISGRFSILEDGFTDFILSDRGRAFLSS